MELPENGCKTTEIASCNITSFVVYLAPVPTFARIIRKKSTEGFQCIPYSVALFSAMLTLYYALLKENNRTMLISINSVGCTIECIYLIIYLSYATRQNKVHTAWLLILFNVVLYGLIVVSTMQLFGGDLRVIVVGWACAAFSVCVFASPLAIMRRVIREKSVEFMPFQLSLCLTFTAIIWFLYGIIIKDFFVAVPNVLGFFLGVAQMILYVIYKDDTKKETELIPETTTKDPTMAVKACDNSNSRQAW
ncbi:hypothetical protein Droror1_Dr00007577 [Drosera rotundifolia]